MKSSKRLLYIVVVLAFVAFQYFAPSSDDPTVPPPSSPVPPNTEEPAPIETNKHPLIKRGIKKHKYSDGQSYFLYVPKAIANDPSLGKEIVAVIHGYSGQARGAKGQNIVLRNIKRFVEYAEEHQAILIAPHFDEERFDSDYQRFNLDATRADVRLIDLIQLTKEAFVNLETEQLKLFGFSGGGQFVHRFCAFHPEIVDRAVTSGSGWYMWPNPTIDYPLGLKLDRFSAVAPINLEKFVACHLMVLIGQEDLTQGSFREEYKELNLNLMQGKDRITRARKWVEAMNAVAQSNGFTSNITLVTVPNTEHTTTNELMDAAFEYLGETVVIN